MNKLVLFSCVAAVVYLLWPGGISYGEPAVARPTNKRRTLRWMLHDQRTDDGIELWYTVNDTKYTVAEMLARIKADDVNLFDHSHTQYYYSDALFLLYPKWMRERGVRYVTYGSDKPANVDESTLMDIENKLLGVTRNEDLP